MADTQEQHESPLVRQLKYCKSLPTLPIVAMQLIELAEDPSATLDQFATLIACDPALVGKLLRTANSSFYGHPRTITNLPEAIGLLGLNATIALALSFSLRGIAGGQPGTSLADTHYWRRSLLTALAARTLATELRDNQPEDFLLAGLLQDIGVLAMSAMLGSGYTRLYKQNADHVLLLEQERAHYGFDHAQAGAQLLKIWRLPESMTDSIQRSHAGIRTADSFAAGTRCLPACVAAAAHIADVWISGVSAQALNTAYESIEPLLDISPRQYQALITSMGREIPNMEAFFETGLIDPAVLLGVEDSAKELLALRTLHQAGPASDADTQIRHLEQRIATLEVQTQRDPMTGLYNRVYLERKLELEFVHAQRTQAPLSAAFVDVDRFKDVNDTYGHAVGDQVLISVANRMLAAARQTDTVARYGGEEFVVLLTNTRVSEARLILERMLANVRDTPCLTRGGARVTITFSAGIAGLEPGGTVFSTPAALIEAADQALYQVKNTARGCIVVRDNKP